MQKSTEIFAAICFLAIGLSHIAQPQAWIDFFIWLRGKGRPGVFVVAFLSLPFGAFIVVFHNVWTGLPMILTIFGWAQVSKGALYFIAPQVGVRTLARVAPERAWMVVAGGFVFTCLSALLFYLAHFQR